MVEMKLEPCTGCGRMILKQPVANLEVRCDPTPLTDVGEIVRLLSSPNPPSLWMVEKDSTGRPARLRGARPGELGPVPEHRCTVNAQEALSRPRSPSPAPSVRPTPQKPSAGRTAPFSGPPAANSSVRRAANPVSDRLGRLDCSICGHPIDLADVETYALIELGATVIDAFHTAGCPID